MIQPVILSGGSGTRLWPLSREQMPKQFLRLTSSQSLLQQTLSRLAGLTDTAPMLMGHHSHRFLMAEQLREMDQAATLVLEPEGRNTAPAIACAALLARQSGDDPLLLVLPADHVIGDVQAFQYSVSLAVSLAEAGYLVTFGVVPTQAETGYGYIACGEPLEGGHHLAAFIEKPDAKRATALVDSGDYLWNSGMFLLRASSYLGQLKRLQPNMLEACEEAVSSAHHDLDFLRLGEAAFHRCPADSIDYAVMEHCDRAAVVPLAAAWSDIGSFDALWSTVTPDAAGNATKGDTWLTDTQDSLVFGEHRLVATLGVNNLIVVETSDSVLVAHRDQAQQVKQLVTSLTQAGRSEPCTAAQIQRPWGSFQAMDRGERYQVKRITVKPGGRLSLQRHHHRAEHWIVVRGTAQVTLEESRFLVTENQSTYIPIGALHRLENTGKIPLELIEVQSGSYLGEDDIERLDDVYARGSSE
ncbi:mannose-1-phosphate guanylyltransferase/mannose-6-phosphate isomerase [Halomonas sp. ATBC28]|uniref:mannose-1-phosphate guanylyltransferase/mannose-6-phosphate isomerase n=1 Tax=Halomonadaceae TaxID=28256 RepID=UPI000482FB6D|nr:MULTISPECIES: mannose-1-phosphate guanylyltransferase/mannose-6-phosphate isomerase [Halomonas]NAO96554.1 mannose-1-phosphate guanylyltransferase/mannose-6-phosphate isomerase [Halomonas sp. MG34]KIN16152.1 mannose-1-phosphate guanyltransferase [Halomonas sp. KHS3]MCD1586228.1 mannose-1-phosphate guanylyltransferase/mannose-6-phosphate isomerase [Halomonas sp. IOP_14]PKH63561.1 mannose-1-phosphate guanylyltransferase/mannose-6-phosphate isomerase [Halomonas sp. Choline-3u-9]TMU25656.1 manno|tara:strand:- start:2288 stop:3697 length:1410 start_codon:yes stop_codon:yes gene_type:complete